MLSTSQGRNSDFRSKVSVFTTSATFNQRSGPRCIPTLVLVYVHGVTLAAVLKLQD